MVTPLGTPFLRTTHIRFVQYYLTFFCGSTMHRRMFMPTLVDNFINIHDSVMSTLQDAIHLFDTSKEPVCPRVELILKIIIILLIIFLGFIKSKPC